MATNAGQLAGMQAGLSELRSRLLFVLIALLVYRIGTHIPVPGINPEKLAQLFSQNQGGILELFNMFSGGAWERMSILALGVMPYITSSIIMNLLSMMHPPLQQLRKARKLTQANIANTFGIGQEGVSRRPDTLSASPKQRQPCQTFAWDNGAKYRKDHQ